ncbi:MAG: glycoside hydrolase family 1 protein [Fusobacteria bacterium]|nr:glycoside hydrolase family 1 protein [Fusobacteriota bacterium]
MKYQFPKEFWWGTACSAPQSEGAADREGKKQNILDYWYEIESNRFFEGVGPDDTSDFYDRYKEDIALMKKLSHNSYRLSVSWSRLIPNGIGEINPKAVEFYNNVINTMIAEGVTPFVNLYHFDMPMELQKQGGFENREFVEWFANYADTCFKLFGDRVKYWFTYNEPIVMPEGGYLYDFFYPNVVDSKRSFQVAYNIVISHLKAVEKFRAGGYPGKIGIILNLSPVYPRSQSVADLKAARMMDLFVNRSFLDPILKGEYPIELCQILADRGLTPVVCQGDAELMKRCKIDIVGLNYYQPRRAKLRENAVNSDAPFMPDHLYDHYEMPGRTMNPYRGWEIYPRGIYDMLIDIRDNYGNIECFISENGMGVENEERFKVDGVIQDDYRIEFIRTHLEFVHKAHSEGCNVVGYHLWTFFDCWSWMNAYKNRYGFVEIDRKNGKKRVIKKSGWWFKELIDKSGFY